MKELIYILKGRTRCRAVAREACLPLLCEVSQCALVWRVSNAKDLAELQDKIARLVDPLHRF